MINGSRQPTAGSEDEQATARLLRMAGMRPEVPADRADRVRRAVHLRWQTRVRRHAVGRRVAGAIALLATAAALVVIVKLKAPREDVLAPLGQVVATAERIEGEARRWPGVSGSSAVSMPLSQHEVLRMGEWVQTQATGRAALRLTDRTSVRLDRNSRARLIATTVIELADGAMYIDTGRSSTGLEVRTALGIARDVGTQFEVRLDDRSLRLRVRTGLVELRRGREATHARAGTELTIAPGGITRGTVAAYGPEWEWASGLAPAFAIEGQPLAVFLENLCREQGWTLRYADATLARAASGIILHGSIEGLQPREALDVTMTTSGLGHRFRDGDVIVFRPPSPR